MVIKLLKTLTYAVVSMASVQNLTPRRGPAKRQATVGEDAHSSSPSSGDDRVAKLARKMRHDVCSCHKFDIGARL